MRAGALTTILLHAREMNACGSRQFADELLDAFVREFTPDKLRGISSMVGEPVYHGGAHGDGFLAYLFCAALAKVAPEASRDQIGTVREALKDTPFEEMVARQLAKVKPKEE